MGRRRDQGAKRSGVPSAARNASFSHARRMDVCILSQEGEILLHRTMKANPEPFLKASERASRTEHRDPHRAQVLVARIEPGTYARLDGGARKQAQRLDDELAHVLPGEVRGPNHP